MNLNNATITKINFGTEQRNVLTIEDKGTKYYSLTNLVSKDLDRASYAYIILEQLSKESRMTIHKKGIKMVDGTAMLSGQAVKMFYQYCAEDSNEEVSRKFLGQF